MSSNNRDHEIVHFPGQIKGGGYYGPVDPSYERAPMTPTPEPPPPPPQNPPSQGN